MSVSSFNLCAVMAAVTFLGEEFSAVNALGLLILIFGVLLFNYTKYKKIISGQAKVPATRARGLDGPQKVASSLRHPISPFTLRFQP